MALLSLPDHAPNARGHIRDQQHCKEGFDGDRILLRELVKKHAQPHNAQEFQPAQRQGPGVPFLWDQSQGVRDHHVQQEPAPDVPFRDQARVSHWHTFVLVSGAEVHEDVQTPTDVRAPEQGAHHTVLPGFRVQVDEGHRNEEAARNGDNRDERVPRHAPGTVWIQHPPMLYLPCQKHGGHRFHRLLGPPSPTQAAVVKADLRPSRVGLEADDALAVQVEAKLQAAHLFR
mmetsp:Transcript_49782/g.132009  ORF Transcript_49782/g.132009 Transcript_49782/m.132009 type:complete len:230 (+) Transcript_49782:1189-1878(+)